MIDGKHFRNTADIMGNQSQHYTKGTGPCSFPIFGAIHDLDAKWPKTENELVTLCVKPVVFPVYSFTSTPSNFDF